MSRASANEIIPGKLYQRGNFMTWPKRQKERLLKELGITVIVNLWSKVDPDVAWEEDKNRLYIQWHTSPSDVPEDAEIHILYLSALLNRGHVVLVHCEAGRGRSVWLSTRLLARYANIPKTEAWERVKVAVVNNSVTPTLLADLGVS